MTGKKEMEKVERVERCGEVEGERRGWKSGEGERGKGVVGGV